MRYIGYKEANPLRPCKSCWNKYARPFSGPVAYSLSPNPGDGNFQRPLPPPPARPIQRPGMFDPPGAFRSIPLSPQPTGFSAPPTIIHDTRPPSNAVVYTAGDPRIGGVLCWGCGGKGHVNLLFLDVNCEVCNGIGRTFS